MGLDMTAYKTKSPINKPVDFEFPQNRSLVEGDESDSVVRSEHESIQIMYWRKHSNLQGWFHNLYDQKGGSSLEFNCVNLELTRYDLLDLKEVIENSQLPYTEGFFYGESYHDDDHKKQRDEEDIEFIEEALSAIESGYNIYYSAWY
jgi:hypothetical protein